MERSEMRDVSPHGKNPGLRFAPSGLRARSFKGTPCSAGTNGSTRTCGSIVSANDLPVGAL